MYLELVGGIMRVDSPTMAILAEQRHLVRVSLTNQLDFMFILVEFRLLCHLVSSQQIDPDPNMVDLRYLNQYYLELIELVFLTYQ